MLEFQDAIVCNDGSYSTPILRAYKNKCAIPKIEDMTNVSKLTVQAVKDYYTKIEPGHTEPRVLEDFREYILPEFLKIFNADNTCRHLSVKDIRLGRNDIDEISADAQRPEPILDKILIRSAKHNKDRLIEDYSYRIEILFDYAAFPSEGNHYIPFMSLPDYEEDTGLLKKGVSRYFFTYMLEQSDGLSFASNDTNNNPPQIDLRTNKNLLSLLQSPTGFKITLPASLAGKEKKISILAIIGGLAIEEGFDCEEIWHEFADYNIINSYKSEDDVLGMMNYGYALFDSATRLTDIIIPRLTCNSIGPGAVIDKSYCTAGLRDELNYAVSLQHAAGQILYRDAVNDKGEVILRAGILLDKTNIRTLECNGIYKIYIKDNVDIVGMELADLINLPHLAKGIRVSDEITNAFPEESNMYLSKTIYAKDVPLDKRDIFLIPKGTIITEELESILLSSGFDSIRVRSGSKVKTVNFYSEVISNRQFKGTWIGKPDDSWYYKNANDEYVKMTDMMGYTTYDFVALYSCAAKIFAGKGLVNIPNIDKDMRKKLIMPDEQFRRAFEYAGRKAIKKARRSLRDMMMNAPQHFSNADSKLTDKSYNWTKLFWEYLTVESKSVRLVPSEAYTNPVAYMAELTKANIYTKGKHSVSPSLRSMSIGSYSKLDPFEVPQGQKLGVVNNLTTGVHIASDGTLMTPYHKVNHVGGKAIVDLTSVEYLDIIQEENTVLTDICSLTVRDDGTIEEPEDTLVICRVPTASVERQLFENRPISEVEYVTRDAIQTLSWSTSIIPFLNHNDAIRACFAVAQIKACKGHTNPEVPRVCTTAYQLLPQMNNLFGMIAPWDGVVVHGSPNHKTEEWTTVFEKYAPGKDGRRVIDGFNMPPQIVRKESMYIQGNNSRTVFTYNYACEQAGITDYSDYSQMTHVGKGQVILESNFVAKDGFLQLGRDCLVAYLPTGYNYEDSCCISTKCADKLRAYRVNSEFVPMPPNRRPYFVYNWNTELGRGGGWINGPANYNNVVKIANHSANVSIEDTKAVALKTLHGYKQQYIPHKNDRGEYDGVEILAVSDDPVEEGDKLSNRHGNKTVVTKVLKPHEMPHLANPCDANFELDILINPHGVPSRRNIGQVPEGQLGLCMLVLNLRLVEDAYNGITMDEFEMIAGLTVDLMNSQGNSVDAICNAYGVNGKWRQHIKNNIQHIRSYAGAFDKHFETTLEWFPKADVSEPFSVPVTNPDVWKSDGRNMSELYEAGSGEFYNVTKMKVSVGLVHEFKLIQEVATKIHARGNEMGNEPYVKMSDAPTHGASSSGGQRVGNMEISALAAYGVEDLMHEYLNERSDNGIARNKFNRKKFLSYKLQKFLDEHKKGQRRSVTQLLYTLLALGVYVEPTDGEIIPLTENYEHALSRIVPRKIQRATTKRRPKPEPENPEETSEDIIPQEEKQSKLLSAIIKNATVEEEPVEVKVEESEPEPSDGKLYYVDGTVYVPYQQEGEDEFTFTIRKNAYERGEPYPKDALSMKVMADKYMAEHKDDVKEESQVETLKERWAREEREANMAIYGVPYDPNMQEEEETDEDSDDDAENMQDVDSDEFGGIFSDALNKLSGFND